jgi:hypothetical protein
LSVSDQCLYLLARVVKSEDYDSFIRSFARPQNDSCALSSSCMCVSLVPCMLMLRSSSQNLTIMMYECITRTLYADATRSSSQNLTIIGTYLVVYHILLWTIRLRFSNWILLFSFYTWARRETSPYWHRNFFLNDVHYALFVLYLL